MELIQPSHLHLPTRPKLHKITQVLRVFYSETIRRHMTGIDLQKQGLISKSPVNFSPQTHFLRTMCPWSWLQVVIIRLAVSR